MGIKAHSLGSLGLALATGKPLVTPLWLQELLPKARLVPPALSFVLSTRQVRAEPCVYIPPLTGAGWLNAAPALLPRGH